jgi:BCD family chlorophyll transporter-like MFS transporter
MQVAPPGQIGLALGAWGAVQATSAGLAIAGGGLLRDAVAAIAASGRFGDGLAGPATGYIAVYLLEITLLFVALAVLGPLVRARIAASGPAPIDGNPKAGLAGQNP